MTRPGADERPAVARRLRRAGHKVWLHIGMPKTGTSAIQGLLADNRKVLRRHGYYYPNFGGKQHMPLVRELAHRAGSPIAFPEEGDCGPYERYTQLLRTQAVRAHTSIISSEFFYQRPGGMPGYSVICEDEPLALIRKTIDEAAEYFAGCDVNVIMWVRRQDKWLMSMYNQTVKSSLYAKDFATYAENTVGADLLSIVGMWVGRFGREHVVCRSYDALMKDGGCILDSFMETVCADVPRSCFTVTKSVRNTSLSNESLWLKKRINHLIREKGAAITEPLLRRIGRLLQEVTAASPEPQAPLLTRPERKALMARYLAGNERLIKDLWYAELQSLIEIDDLEEGGEETVEESVMLLPAMDHMIEAMVLAPPKRGLGKRGEQ